MARESENFMRGSKETAVKTVCPLHGDPARDAVDWAGLPVNLDLSFSQNQLDKVYTQYLRRRQKPVLKRRSPDDAAPHCACGLADWV